MMELLGKNYAHHGPTLSKPNIRDATHFEGSTLKSRLGAVPSCSVGVAGCRKKSMTEWHRMAEC